MIVVVIETDEFDVEAVGMGGVTKGRRFAFVLFGDSVRIISALRAPMIPFALALPKHIPRTYAPPSAVLFLFTRGLRRASSPRPRVNKNAAAYAAAGPCYLSCDSVRIQRKEV